MTIVEDKNDLLLAPTSIAVANRLKLPFAVRMQCLALAVMHQRDVKSSYTIHQALHTSACQALLLGITQGLIKPIVHDQPASKLVQQAIKDVLGEAATKDITYETVGAVAPPLQWFNLAVYLNNLHQHVVGLNNEVAFQGTEMIDLEVCESLFEYMCIRSSAKVDWTRTGKLFVAAVYAAAFCLTIGDAAKTLPGPLLIKWLSDLTQHRTDSIQQQARCILQFVLN